MFYYQNKATPPPPPDFMTLEPQGDTVKGSPTPEAAPKVGATTPAPASHPRTEPVQPPEPVTPPPTAATEPPPDETAPKIIENNAPVLAHPKPKAVKPKPKPKPKIKVDLHLADAPTPPTPTPPKHKHVVKKTPPPSDQSDAPDRDTSSPDNMGLSKDEIAQRLGEKLKAAGVDNSEKTGVSGSTDGHQNSFADFYAAIHDQVMNKWQEPNLDAAQAVNPVVQIHVEKDGRVPPEQVVLLRGSGNQAIDDSAINAAKSLGYLHEPLPDGCPPDISISFKLSQ
jgi:outer membrane biosynthesis protein TonB